MTEVGRNGARHGHMLSWGVSVPSFGTPISPGETYVKITQPPAPSPAHESDLLKSIRRALSATTPIPHESPRRTLSANPNGEGEEELFWVDRTVIWSVGGIQQRKWVFDTENKDQVLWACWANFQSEKFTLHGQMPLKTLNRLSTTQNRLYTSVATTDEDVLSTFGRFSGIRPLTAPEATLVRNYHSMQEPSHPLRCICIFLTSFVIIYTKDGGIEYAANMPLRVKRVWELGDHGVLIERVPGPEDDDDDFPMMYTLSGPYDELRVPGFAYSIEGGVQPTWPRNPNDSPAPTSDALIRKDPANYGDPSPKSFSRTDRIIYSSSESSPVCDRIVVTHDPISHWIRVWRYVRDPLVAKHSMDMHGSNTPRSGSPKSKDEVNLPDHIANQPPSNRPLRPDGSKLPDTPNEETVADTLAMAQRATGDGLGALPPPIEEGTRKAAKGSRNGHIKQPSQSRNELSMSMDRMVLNTPGDEIHDLGLGGRAVGGGLTVPEFWFTCIYEMPIQEEGETPGDVHACFYDVRLDVGKLVVCAPQEERIHVFVIGFQDNKVNCKPIHAFDGIAMAPVVSLRPHINDLLIVRPNSTIAVVTYDYKELDVKLTSSQSPEVDVDLEDLTKPARIPMPDRLRRKLPTGTVRPIALKDAVGSSVTVAFSDGSDVRINLDLTPGDLVNRMFMSMSYILSSEKTFSIRKRYLRRWTKLGRSGTLDEEFSCCAEAIIDELCQGDITDQKTRDGAIPRTTSVQVLPDAWTQLSNTISHEKMSVDTALRHLTLPPESTSVPPSRPHIGRIPLPRRITNPPKWASPAMQVLHLLGESFKVTMGKERELRILASFLLRLGRFVSPDWSNHWAVLAPDDPDAWMPADSYAFTRDAKLPPKPQDIFHYLLTRLNSSSPAKTGHFMSISQIHQAYGYRPSLEFGPIRVNRISRVVLDAYMALTDFKHYTEPLDRAKAAVTVLYKSGITSDNISQLPFGISVPLKEALSLCQEFPPMDWEPGQYILIDRFDLAKMASINYEHHVSGFGEAYRYKQEAVYKDARETIGSVVLDAKTAADGLAADDIEASLANREFTDVRFGVDRRLREVDRMLQSSSLTTVKILERPDLNEHDLAKEQHQFAVVIAERTLALSLGRAMYTYGSLNHVDSDSFSIPRIDYSVRMVPQGTTIVVDHLKAIHLEGRMWGEFHNGVAAALRISRGAVGVDSSWIAYNRPVELTAEHAGFICGLGLNGHLDGMRIWHVFSYLTPKHDLTSIGMLVGLAASHVGRGDVFALRTVALHTPALLPPGSAETNLSLWTQMAGVMSVGILFLGRRDRRMAEVCLNEIGGREFGPRLDVTNENREAYSVTAALAFGMIMCGHGQQATSPADLDMISRLRILIHGQPDASDSKQYQPIFGANLTSSAAAIALGLMFMKTGRTDIAGLFDMVYTPLVLARVQPNVLLVRALSRLLILWDDIQPTVEWVTSQVPKKMVENEELQGYDDAVKDSYDLAYYNIVAGVCFAMALKYAGSADQTAETTLIHYYDALSKTASQPAQTYDAQIKRSAVRDSLNLLSISLGIVMAGTGELNALRRLRYAHGQLMPYIRYGSHMTSHMALGMLFLGGGKHTIGTSNAAIACLVAAFYPRWPNSSSESKGLLPVFRHLWALAVEPRCLVARDADSGETVYIPVKISIRDGNYIKTFQYTSPSLIPDFNRLIAINVDSPRYWPYSIDFSADSKTPRLMHNVLRNQTIWVKRRSGYLGYGEDPRGNRSIFAFIGFRIGDTATMDFPNGSTEERQSVLNELEQFITSFSVDTRTIGFADWVCHADPQSELEAKVVSYCQQGLLECLIHDKASALPTLMKLFQMRYGTSNNSAFGTSLPSLLLKNLKFLNTYYSHVHSRSFGGRIGKDRGVRTPVVRLSLLQATLNVMDNYVQSFRSEETFKEVLGAYLRGEDCRSAMIHKTQESSELARRLALYLINENVPGVEIISAVSKMGAEAIATRKIGKSDEELNDAKLHKMVKTVVRSVLLNANATPMCELTWHGFEDISQARGF